MRVKRRILLKVPAGYMGSAASHSQSPTEPNAATGASSEADDEEQDHGIQVKLKPPKELVLVMVCANFCVHFLAKSPSPRSRRFQNPLQWLEGSLHREG